jgi:hypothetical protein
MKAALHEEIRMKRERGKEEIDAEIQSRIKKNSG